MLELRPIRVANGEHSEGFLVLSDDALVAVLVRLSEQQEEYSGHWYLEAGFGSLAVALNPIFDTLEGAKIWVSEQLARGA